MRRDRQTKLILDEEVLGTAMLYSCASLIRKWSNDWTVEGAEKAEELLERVVSSGEDFETDRRQLYNICIRSWARVDESHRAEALLRRMEERHLHAMDGVSNKMATMVKYKENTTVRGTKGYYKAELSPCPNPDLYSYNSMLTSWKNSSDDNLEKIKKMFDQMKTDLNIPDPDSTTYNIVMDALYATPIGEYGLAQRAEDVLLSMSEEKATDVAANVAPDTFTFNTVLKAWKNSREGIESAKRAEAILRIMIKYDLTNDGRSDIGPDRISFATVMETYICNYVDEPGEALNGFRRVMDLIKDSRSTKEFQEILSHCFGVVIGNMEEYGLNDPTKVAELIFHDITNGENVAVLDTGCFNKMIGIYSKNGEEKRVSEIYRQMHLSNISPNQVTYNTMMDMYFRNKQSDLTRNKAIHLLAEMEKSYEARCLEITSSLPFDTVINMVSKSSDKELHQKAFEILENMFHHFRSGNDSLCPDTLTCNIVLSTLAKDGSNQSAERATRLLQKMTAIQNDIINPDMLSYTEVIRAWLRSNKLDGNRRAMDLLHEVEKNDTIRLDITIFEIILHELSRGRRKNDSKFSKYVLNRMISIYKEGNELVKPTAKCYNLTLKAICSNDSWQEKSVIEAHETLLNMVKRYKEDNALPDRVGFNTVITSWVKSRDIEAVGKIEELFVLMKELDRERVKDVSPDKYTLSLLLAMYSRSSKLRSAKKAQNIIDETNSDSLDCVTYNSLISVWGKSRELDKVERVLKILDIMIEKNIADIISYNTAINACAFAVGNKEAKEVALKSALEVFHKLLLTSIFPNELTFATLLKACKILSNSILRKEKLIQVVFEHCKKRGLIGNLVTKELKDALSNNKRRILLGNNLEGEIPKKWFRNLK